MDLAAKVRPALTLTLSLTPTPTLTLTLTLTLALALTRCAWALICRPSSRRRGKACCSGRRR